MPIPASVVTTPAKPTKTVSTVEITAIPSSSFAIACRPSVDSSSWPIIQKKNRLRIANRSIPLASGQVVRVQIRLPPGDTSASDWTRPGAITHTTIDTAVPRTAAAVVVRFIHPIRTHPSGASPLHPITLPGCQTPPARATRICGPGRPWVRAVVGMIGWDHPGGSVRGDAAGRRPEPALVTPGTGLLSGGGG